METNSSPGHRSCSTVIQRGREHWVPGPEQKNLAKLGTQAGSQVTDGHVESAPPAECRTRAEKQNRSIAGHRPSPCCKNPYAPTT